MPPEDLFDSALPDHRQRWRRNLATMCGALGRHVDGAGSEIDIAATVKKTAADEGSYEIEYWSSQTLFFAMP